MCCREKEIEQKISRLDVKEGEKGEERGGGGAYRPPAARDREPSSRDDRQRDDHIYCFSSQYFGRDCAPSRGST